MRRTQKQRQVRNTILIITNGKETEQNYFNSIKACFDSIFTINVEFKNKQCDELVQYACSLEATAYNQIWCLFDIDDAQKEGHLSSAIEKAKRGNIKIAFSNEAFEVWLLYHFTKSVSPKLNRKTYILEINKQLQAQGYSATYEKNNKTLLASTFVPRALVATERAKTVYQRREADHKTMYGNANYPVAEWKSISTVYQLIESLQLTQREN